MSTELTIAEKRTLEACEIDIERGRQNAVDGMHLMSVGFAKIRDEKLYRATHKTFDEYCPDKWNLTHRQVNHLIAHHKSMVRLLEYSTEQTVNNLGTMVPKITERAGREIRDLTTEDQAKVVKKVIAGGLNPTAKNLREAREAVSPKHQLQEFFEEKDQSAAGGKGSARPAEPRKDAPAASSLSDSSPAMEMPEISPFAFMGYLTLVDQCVQQIATDMERRAAGRKIRKVADKHDPPKRPKDAPTLEEVRNFIEEKKHAVDPEHFWNHYEANGWRQGNGQPIKKWQSAVVTWNKNSDRFGKSHKPGAGDVYDPAAVGQDW